MLEGLKDDKLRGDLLDKLKVSISEADLDELIFKTLPPEKQQTPSGKDLTQRIIWFINEVIRLDKEYEMWTVLDEMRSDIVADLNIAIPDPVEPERPNYCTGFFNRENEWQDVVRYPPNDKLDAYYCLFDAPAGYGKTALVRKISREFNRRDWISVLICLKTGDRLLHFANSITDQLDIDDSTACLQYLDNPERMGLEFGKIVANRLTDQEGVALLLDVDKRTDDTVLETVKNVVEEFIPGFYEGLKHNYDQASCRFVIAGRYLATKILHFQEGEKPEFDIRILRPFNYRVTRNLCKHHFQENQKSYNDHKDILDEFAANLLFYSGGHPGCMVKILKQFDESSVPPLDFFKDQEQMDKISHEIMAEEAGFVLRSLPPEWKTAFEVFCIYRFLTPDLLHKFIEEKMIYTGLAAHEYELKDKLIYSHLMAWRDPGFTIHDEMTRRVLAVGRRISIGLEEFKSECERAKNFCKQCLEKFDEDRAYWVIEILFQYLHAHTREIDTQEKREALRSRFMGEIVSDTLCTMTDGSKHHKSHHWDMLQGRIDNDDEFVFTVNYYLRDGHYNNSPLQELKKNVKRHLFPETKND